LKYNDGHEEDITLTELNAALRQRHNSDFGGSDFGGGGGGSESAQGPHLKQPRSRREDRRQQLDNLLAGVVEDWTKSAWAKLAYDHWHFLKNWFTMVAADKHSPITRAFMMYSSDAIFKMLPKEYDRLLEHLKHLGIAMSDERIKRLSRRYLRRMLRYGVGEPTQLVRDLFDVFCFFDDMEDPERPGQRVLVDDAFEIMDKEMKYVQRGLLSDLPGMDMYRAVKKLKTGFVMFRTKRNSSALEGQHLHYRAASGRKELRADYSGQSFAPLRLLLERRSIRSR